MSAGHTPGPWFAVGGMVEVGRDAVPDICTANPQLFGQGHLPRSDAEIMANTRLIATAPDLLAEMRRLCRAYVALLETGRDRIIAMGGDCDPVDRMEEGDPALRAARAVIARATGAA